MSIIDDMLDDWLAQDALGLYDDDEEIKFDDTLIMASKQKPHYPGGVDWRYEEGGALHVK